MIEEYDRSKKHDERVFDCWHTWIGSTVHRRCCTFRSARVLVECRLWILLQKIRLSPVIGRFWWKYQEAAALTSQDQIYWLFGRSCCVVHSRFLGRGVLWYRTSGCTDCRFCSRFVYVCTFGMQNFEQFCYSTVRTIYRYCKVLWGWCQNFGVVDVERLTVTVPCTFLAVLYIPKLDISTLLYVRSGAKTDEFAI